MSPARHVPTLRRSFVATAILMILQAQLSQRDLEVRFVGHPIAF